MCNNQRTKGLKQCGRPKSTSMMNMNLLKEMSLRRKLSSSSASATEIIAGSVPSEDVPCSSWGKTWKKTNREMNGYASLRRSSKLLPRSKTTSHDLGDFLHRRRVYIPHSATRVSLSNNGGEMSGSNSNNMVISDWSYCRPPPKPSVANPANLASQSQSPSQSKNCTRRARRSKSAVCRGSNYKKMQYSPHKALVDQDDGRVDAFVSCSPFVINKTDMTDFCDRKHDTDSVIRFSLKGTSQLHQRQGAIGEEVEEDPSDCEGKTSTNYLDPKIYPKPTLIFSTTEERLSTRKSKYSMMHDGDKQKPLLSLALPSYSSSSPNTLSPCSSSNSATTSNSISRMHQLPQYTTKLSHSSSLGSFKAAKTVTTATVATGYLDLDLDTQAERFYVLQDFVNTQEKEKITQVGKFTIVHQSQPWYKLLVWPVLRTGSN